MSAPQSANVTVVEHPLVLHKLTHLRQKERSTSSFRSLLAEISMLLVYEATRHLPLVYESIETPLASMRAPVLDGSREAEVIAARRDWAAAAKMDPDGVADVFRAVLTMSRRGQR